MLLFCRYNRAFEKGETLKTGGNISRPSLCRQRPASEQTANSSFPLYSSLSLSKKPRKAGPLLFFSFLRLVVVVVLSVVGDIVSFFVLLQVRAAVKVVPYLGFWTMAGVLLVLLV